MFGPALALVLMSGQVHALQVDEPACAESEPEPHASALELAETEGGVRKLLPLMLAFLTPATHGFQVGGALHHARLPAQQPVRAYEPLRHGGAQMGWFTEADVPPAPHSDTTAKALHTVGPRHSDTNAKALHTVGKLLESPELERKLTNKLVKLATDPQEMTDAGNDVLTGYKKLTDVQEVLHTIAAADLADHHDYATLKSLFDKLDLGDELSAGIVKLAERLCKGQAVPYQLANIQLAVTDPERAEAAGDAILRAATGRLDMAFVSDVLGFLDLRHSKVSRAAAAATFDILKPALGAPLAKEASEHVDEVNWPDVMSIVKDMGKNGVTAQDLDRLAQVLQVDSWVGRAVGEMVVAALQKGPFGTHVDEKTLALIQEKAGQLRPQHLLDSPSFTTALATLEGGQLDYHSLTVVFQELGLDDQLPKVLAEAIARVCHVHGLEVPLQNIETAMQDKGRAEEASDMILRAATGKWDATLAADALGALGLPGNFAHAAAKSAREVLTPVIGVLLAGEVADRIDSTNWNAVAPVLSSIELQGRVTGHDLHVLATAVDLDAWAGRAVGEVIGDTLQMFHFPPKTIEDVRKAAAMVKPIQLLEQDDHKSPLAALVGGALDYETLHGVFEQLGLTHTILEAGIVDLAIRTIEGHKIGGHSIHVDHAKVHKVFADPTRVEAAADAVIRAATHKWDLLLAADLLEAVGLKDHFPEAFAENAKKLLTPLVGEHTAGEVSQKIGANWAKLVPYLQEESTPSAKLRQIGEVLFEPADRALGAMIALMLRKFHVDEHFVQQIEAGVGKANVARIATDLFALHTLHEHVTNGGQFELADAVRVQMVLSDVAHALEGTELDAKKLMEGVQKHIEAAFQRTGLVPEEPAAPLVPQESPPPLEELPDEGVDAPGMFGRGEEYDDALWAAMDM